jgi:hypothetical protein
MHLPAFFVGPVLILIGCAIRFKIAKRKFLRRSMTGLEYFPSYSAAVVTRLVEAMARAVATLMILAGVVLFLGATI